DAYDTVEWLVKHVTGNNGRVGVHGISYPGFLAAMAGIDPHAAVKAVSPQAPMTDVWMGDDFFHNGAFRQSYGYDYTMGMESSKTDAFGKMEEDAYDYFLKAGNFANAAKKGRIDGLPTARAFVEHPAYDAFWQAMAVTPWLTRVTVPTFLVGGWWDEEDMWGPQAEYAAMAAHDPEHKVQMMLGPWLHGQWAQRTMRHLDALDFGQATTEEFRAEEAAFFDEHLKSSAAGARYAAVESFQTGSNTWRGYSAWPPKQAKMRDMYLEANAALSFERPKVTDREQSASYLSDPAHPVPYRHRPIQETYAPGSHWYAWLAEDQRFVTGRKDVAAWETPVLDHDLTVTGDVKADLYASTTGSDADWVVKLIDVYPGDAGEGMGGYQLMVAEEIFRGRYRESFTQPHAIVPGAVNEYAWSLHGVDHVFLKGHRLMVTVQSSWFPLYDRNPQTFVPNIMAAPASAYKKATESIYESAQHPSHVELPVVENR
ncbi:MAG TPA: CocE/NonD family hydrolase, partial [Acidobacteriaceae bacterium]|nr:CocE/NonD family hydrolase [Acidobacteriaceae bacterium]